VPALSVVIPSYNRPDLLELCLASVARHAPPDTEVVVVDDSSVDAVVSAVAARHRGVRVLRLPRRSGFCVAANRGMRAASSEFVELLNDDATVTPGWADAALAALAKSGVGAVAPLVLACPDISREGPTVDSAGDRYFIGGIAGKRGHGRPLGPEFLEPRPVFGASACAAFYRRDAFLAVGGFPASFGAYFEDIDLSFRLHHAGWQILYEPASRVLHRVSSSYGIMRPDLLARQSRNEERVFWRNLPRRELLRALPMHLAVVAAKAYRRWREGTLLPFVCGRLAVLGEVGEICVHRRRLARRGWPVSTPTFGIESQFWG
jgi:GT2 family glycosyltransferase